MEDLTAVDPYTGETFTKKRSNQRFASLKTKNAYHNAKAREDRKITSAYTKPSLYNRKFLIKIMENKDELIVSRDYLLGGGFDLRYYTGYKQKTGIIGVFEFILTIAENDKIKITKIKKDG